MPDLPAPHGPGDTDRDPVIDILRVLLDFGIPFIDVGMDVDEVNGRLIGVVRTTMATRDKQEHVTTRIKYTDAGFEGDYRTNIQIAELKARNASDAVVGWKKYRGIYADLFTEHSSAFTIASNHVVNEETTIAAADKDTACG
jgi:hypothetical protein